MDFDAYAKYTHFYTDDEIPSTLRGLMETHSWQAMLDLGCGDGALLAALQRDGLLAGKAIYAVDVSARRIENVKQLNPAFHCYVDNASDLQHIAPNSVDLVVSEMVIEHVPDDEAMVAQIAKVLKPGGLAYITTVFKKDWAWYFYRCNGEWVLDPTHVREYTAEGQLLDYFTQHNLSIQSERKLPIRFHVLSFILRRLPVNVPNDIYQRSPLLDALRRASRVRVPGYFDWQIVAQKP